MLGTIESYDSKSQTGVIKSEDGHYAFHIDNWQEEELPENNDDVSFEEKDGEIYTVSLVGAYLSQQDPVKSRIIAGLLGMGLGAIGAHRFYLGFYTIGIAQIVVTALTLGYGVLWGFIEGVLLLSGNMDKDAKNRPLK
jgi:TM2 domain-containing membrane protein YozV